MTNSKEHDSIDVLFKQAEADGVSTGEYVKRKANLALLTDANNFGVDESFFIVEVRGSNRVRVMASRSTAEDAAECVLVISAATRRSRKRASTTIDYLIVPLGDGIDALGEQDVHDFGEPQVLDGLIGIPPTIPRPEVDLRASKTFFKPTTVWSRTASRPRYKF
jgi:hypothetical protein